MFSLLPPSTGWSKDASRTAPPGQFGGSCSLWVSEKVLWQRCAGCTWGTPWPIYWYQLVVPALTLLSAQAEEEEQLQVPPHQIALGNPDSDLVMLTRSFLCDRTGGTCRTRWFHLTPCPLDEGQVTITLSSTYL